MNSSENYAYWNESDSSKFDFELNDNKYEDLLLEDVIDTSYDSRNSQGSAYYSSSLPTLKVESISNYLSEYCVNCILDSDGEKNELSSLHHIPIDEEVTLLRRKLKVCFRNILDKIICFMLLQKSVVESQTFKFMLLPQSNFNSVGRINQNEQCILSLYM